MRMHVKGWLSATALAFAVLGQPAAAQVSLRAWPQIAAWGQYVDLEAYVKGCNFFDCGAPLPSGTVDFLVDGTLSFTSPVGIPSTGRFLTNTLSVGTHSVVASYSGDSNWSPSTSDAVPVFVVKASTSTGVAGHAPVNLGQPIDITVLVQVEQPGAGTPTGTVAVSDGVGDTCTITLPSQTCALTPTAPGTLTLVARYQGDANFNPSTGIGGLPVNTSGHAIGGTIAGLAGSGLVLHLEHAGGTEDLPVAAGSSTFAFASTVAYGTVYGVTVASQPTNPRETCTVANGLGSMPAGDVGAVAVTCVPGAYSVGGAVIGLVGSGLVLRINGGGELPIGADGSFAFAPMTDGSPYAVTVATQPANPGQVCSVANDHGMLASADVTNVLVTCASLYTVGGVVAGLDGTLVLQVNGGDDLQLSGGPPHAFTFATPLPSGTGYGVTILAQPPNQNCFVSNASGTIANANVVDVSVSCQGNDPPMLQLTVDDGRAYAGYGETLQYTVTLTNVGGSAASGVPVSGAYGTALDAGSAQWQCAASPGAFCNPGGAGALFDFADLSPGSSAVWTVQVPVLGATGETTVDFTVNAGPLASDVDTLVIFRNGFDGD